MKTLLITAVASLGFGEWDTRLGHSAGTGFVTECPTARSKRRTAFAPR